MAKCIFRREWWCPVEADEIPFEVCRLCIEARRTQTVMAMSRQGMAEEPPAELFQPPITSTKEEPAQSLSSLLSELDRRLFEGRIGMDEYLEERKRIIDSHKQNGESQFIGLEKILEVRGESRLGLILVKRGKLGISATAYPQGLPLYKGLNRKLVESIFELCTSAGEQAENMLVKLKDVKLAKIALKDGKLMLLALEPNQNPEEYEEENENILHDLKKAENWEKILPQLYEKHFKSKKSDVASSTLTISVKS